MDSSTLPADKLTNVITILAPALKPANSVLAKCGEALNPKLKCAENT